MAQKHLKELLKEDQEPFFLKDYIADRSYQLKTRASHQKNHLQVKKRKPISENRNFPGKFCKNACFFSINDSPDLRKSPLFEFPSPAKSPCKSPNAIFLHIPARTAALLLEAALRIQKQSSSSSSSSSSSKPKTQKQNHGFGLFGSFLKRLTHRNRSNQTKEIEGNGVKLEENIMSTGSHDDDREVMTACENSGSCPCTGRPSSAIWSESNEEKSLDLETSSSSSSHQYEEDSDEIDFLTKLMRGGEAGTTDFAFCDHENDFCQSPFRFVLSRSPSSGHRTPEFSSPATSPSRHIQEDKKNYVTENSKELQQVEEEEEEEKEQFSPVSVLDPPFEDDYDGHDDEDDGFDMESSYASVQRTKQQLLQKLRRFEKLAELDPIELEKRMLEQEGDDDYDINNPDEEEEECEDEESNIDVFVREVLSKSGSRQVHRTPEHMKRLVSDLIFEEKREQSSIDNREEVVKRVCKRFESWKEVQSNTIDMMIEQDFRAELEEWKNNKEQVGETAVEIEFAIFGLLVEELAAELVCLDGK